MSHVSGDEDEGEAGDLFAEPEGFYQAEKQPTFVTHKTLDGTEVNLRLVGSSPLWVGHERISSHGCLSAKVSSSLRSWILRSLSSPSTKHTTRVIYSGRLDA